MSQIFTILPNILTDFGTRLIQTLLRRDTFYERNAEIYQSIRAFPIRKGLELEKRKFFERGLAIFTENGFTTKVYRNSPPNYTAMKFEKRGGQDGFTHYDGLQDYIASNTLTTALAFDKLDYLFRCYFALVIAILFLFLFHWCIKTIVVHQFWFVRTKRKLNAFIKKCGQKFKMVLFYLFSHN